MFPISISKNPKKKKNNKMHFPISFKKEYFILVLFDFQISFYAFFVIMRKGSGKKG